MHSTRSSEVLWPWALLSVLAPQWRCVSALSPSLFLSPLSVCISFSLALSVSGCLSLSLSVSASYMFLFLFFAESESSLSSHSPFW